MCAAQAYAFQRIRQVTCASWQHGDAGLKKTLHLLLMHRIAESGGGERKQGAKGDAAGAGERGVDSIKILLDELPHDLARLRRSAEKSVLQLSRIDTAAEY